jgi:hypothetical protein
MPSEASAGVARECPVKKLGSFRNFNGGALAPHVSEL